MCRHAHTVFYYLKIKGSGTAMSDGTSRVLNQQSK